MRSDLERRYRRVLRWLPGWYRERWEQDMVAAFLDGWLTGDPEADQYITRAARPSLAEVASVAGLAVRLHLGGPGTPRRCAWGQAIRRAVLAVLLVHAVLAVDVLVFLVWSRRLVGWLPAPRQQRPHRRHFPVPWLPRRTQDMPCQHPPRPLPVLASALVAAGLVLAVAGCSHITPLGPDPAPVSLPPARDLGSPIIVQVMRSQPPTSPGRCPAGSVALFGSDPAVPRTAVAPAGPAQPVQGSTATPPATPATPPAPLTGVACFLPAGTPVTITSAAVSSVTTHPHQPGPAWYGFVVAFPAADVPALTALIRQAYDSGEALGMSVAGKLWQAPQPRRKFIALRAEQINLLSRTQALQLYRLLVPAG